MNYADPRNKDLHFVYRVFRGDGALLYIGCTRDPWSRFTQHRYRAAWWDEAYRAEWIPAGCLFAAQELEMRMIRSERPLYNFQHNSASARAAHERELAAIA